MEKNKLLYYVLGILTSLLISITSMAQQRKISGVVQDANTNNPLDGATVTLKNSNISTITKADGKFEILVPNAKSELIVSFVGYQNQDISAKGLTKINIYLQPSAKSLNEVVVVGYGTQKRVDITGSVASVPKERLSKLPVTNVLQAIEGSVAGVNITESSSVPGESPSVLIRGINSINSTTAPFIVVDGIPFDGSLNDINTADIASIEILKDVSAVAIYGTRGSNGVILVTTKRGKIGKATITYHVYGGFENFAHTVEPMNPEQYVQKYADWKIEAGSPDASILPNSAEQANYAAGVTTNWIDKISQQGLIQSHTLSISGGNKDVKYYVSGDYLNQKGVIKGYQYHRASVRSNIDATITHYLSVGVNLFLTTNNSDGGRADLNTASTISPYGTFANADGSYAIYPMFPELTLLSPMLGLTNDRNDRSKNIRTSFYAELKPSFVKGLKYRINASYSYVPTLFQSYSGRPAGNFLGTAEVDNSETTDWLIENVLTYEKDWNKSHVDATGLYSAQQTYSFSSGTTATGFINDVLSFNNLSAASSQSGTSFASKTNFLSQMLRINYSYNSKYLFTVTARRDGYSAFGSNTNKYGLFPSVALGWNISNEKFMKNSKFINNLKLRGSYGLAGNSAIGPNATTTTSSTVLQPFNGLSTIGVVANVLGNSNLKWESTYGSNIGIDFVILDNRISGTIEAYSTKTNSLVLYRSVPAITGYVGALDNLGKVSNKGFELTLNTKNLIIKNFKWETSLNFSTNKNKILDLYGNKKDDVGNRWFIGKPINIIYDYKLEGVWQVEENPANQDPGANPGDFKFADLDGSKTITTADRTIIGQSVPKWRGGITNTFHYKNFQLSVFIQTVQGITEDNTLMNFRDYGGRENLPAEPGYWTSTNKNNSRSGLTYTNNILYGYPANASYTRIKDATLSYTAPKSLLNKIKLGAVTLYISGRNLITFTKWVGWDPEVAYSSSYPLVRSVIIGANITLL